MKRRCSFFVCILSSFMIFLLISLPFCLSIELNLSYDGNGNLITGDGKYREYNEFNQLIRIWNGSSSGGKIIEEYIYHPIEDRILAKKVYDQSYISNDHLVETVIYANENLVRTITYPSANSINTTDKIYVKDENGIVAEFNPDQSKVFYHNDHLGSTNTLTNDSGSVVEQTFYEPFGGIVTGGNTSRFYYEGKDLSSSTGEYDFNFRKYNPDLKIFTKPDSGVSNVYDPQSLNRYSFERNNPYKYVDPDGKAAIPYHFIGSYIVSRDKGFSRYQSFQIAIGSILPDFDKSTYKDYKGYWVEEEQYFEKMQNEYNKKINSGDYIGAGAALHALVDQVTHKKDRGYNDLNHYIFVDFTPFAYSVSFQVPNNFMTSNVRSLSINIDTSGIYFDKEGQGYCGIMIKSKESINLIKKDKNEKPSTEYCNTHSDRRC